MNATLIINVLLEDEDFDMEELFTAALTPKEAYEMAIDHPELRPQLDRVIATDARWSYYYAKYVLKGPFPAGEPAIAKDVGWSYEYAKDIIERRFPAGEPVIATKREYAKGYNEAFGTNL